MAKTAKTSETIEKEQERAAFHFLPFCVDVFSRRRLNMKRAGLLPVRRPEALTLEVVEALEEVMSRGALAFLCRQGGWRAQSVARRGKDNPMRKVRLIDPRIWRREDRHLAIGDEAIDALLIGYNAVCQAVGQGLPSNSSRKRRDYPQSRDMGFARNGDMLVHHIMWLKVREAPFKINEHYWHYLTENPLTRYARLDLRDVEAEEILERLYAPDFGRLLEWLTPHLVACWLAEFETRWDTLERFQRLHEGMMGFFEALVHRARRDERRDLLRAPLAFFQAHFAHDNVEDQWEREFNRLARDLRFADREVYRRTWGGFMQVAWQIHEEYAATRSVHPVDREASDKVFMEAVEAVPDFDALAQRIRAYADQLNARIG